MRHHLRNSVLIPFTKEEELQRDQEELVDTLDTKNLKRDDLRMLAKSSHDSRPQAHRRDVLIASSVSLVWSIIQQILSELPQVKLGAETKSKIDNLEAMFNDMTTVDIALTDAEAQLDLASTLEEINAIELLV